jgi:hypothetical protein
MTHKFFKLTTPNLDESNINNIENSRKFVDSEGLPLYVVYEGKRFYSTLTGDDVTKQIKQKEGKIAVKPVQEKTAAVITLSPSIENAISKNVQRRSKAKRVA